MHRNRVKVTLNDEATVAIRRLSLASGESMSGLISTLFEPNISAINEMSELLEQAAKIRGDLPVKSREFFRSIMAQVRNENPANEPAVISEPVDLNRQQVYSDVQRIIDAENRKKAELATKIGASGLVDNSPRLSGPVADEVDSGRLDIAGGHHE